MRTWVSSRASRSSRPSPAPSTATPSTRGHSCSWVLPGVGKTSLWEAGLAGGHERGLRVLVARASASETGLPFAGLIDLLDEVSGEDLDEVPPPQRHALEVALYRAEPGEQPPTDHVVSLALLSALRVLAQDRHVLVAIDDVQWLDASSQAALAYASRRLADHVTLLLSRRPGPPGVVEQALPDDRVDRVDGRPGQPRRDPPDPRRPPRPAAAAPRAPARPRHHPGQPALRPRGRPAPHGPGPRGPGRRAAGARRRRGPPRSPGRGPLPRCTPGAARARARR